MSDHAYAVIEALEIQHPIDGKVKLLKLRNPWGHKEWMGAWSDKSDKWTDQLRRELSVENSDDGVFYISYEDYMNYYRSTTICKVIDGFTYHNIPV